jgi:hypothetical protein
MSAVFCKLLRLLPAGSRPRPLFSRAQPASGGWNCLELGGQPVTAPQLRAVRELVVRDPAALTADVLAAAVSLRAVVLPAHRRLSAAIVAELARRRIATVWRQPEFVAGQNRDGLHRAAPDESDPFGPAR